MQQPSSSSNEFLDQLTEVVEQHLSNEQFGVSELAEEIGMSRSNLLRKVKKTAQVSVSQFIRQVRLKNALKLLEDKQYTISEIAYKVGFGSTSYFIKCFHDEYGYSPGKMAKGEVETAVETEEPLENKKLLGLWVGVGLIAVIMAIGIYQWLKPDEAGGVIYEKSIAVLPFINDSNDSSNVHIVNGLMESILGNLQTIEDLRVISRTSVEKYRHEPKSIAEISKELDVNYFVEGSGQKIGDQIKLKIQLIEAPTDRQVWSQSYTREASDIFALQAEVAKSIADQIEVIIKPEEIARIEKIPTDNLEAYELFLKGSSLMFEVDTTVQFEAIKYFQEAIKLDEFFARAYAAIGITYYFIDANREKKIYFDSINHYADLALLIDPQMPQSLIAKAVYYIHHGENQTALPYLEKALENNPNSALVINILSDYYARLDPDPEKYLQYALKGVGLDIASNDSVTASFIYLHLSNAFIQSGFVDEAINYIDVSLTYDSTNIFSMYVRAFILYAKNNDLEETERLLVKTYERDTFRLDILQDIAKINYFQHDFDSAYYYYNKFLTMKNAFGLDIYQFESLKISEVMRRTGREEEAAFYLQEFLDYAETDESIYKPVNKAMVHAYHGEVDEAIEQLAIFSKEDNFQYWMVLFFPDEPLADYLKDHPEYDAIVKKIEDNFWERHRKVRESLERKGLI